MARSEMTLLVNLFGRILLHLALITPIKSTYFFKPHEKKKYEQTNAYPVYRQGNTF